MSKTRIGSARVDERGKYSGGKSGDQTGKEVSEQNFYVHSKGWFVLRPKDPVHADKIAERMKAACNNPFIGYDQGNRLAITKVGIDTKSATECDCSSLVRQCVREACGLDPGNFTTANEKGMLLATGLFEDVGGYRVGVVLYPGDVLVTKSKGHTVIVTEGAQRTAPIQYYPKCKSSYTSIVDGLLSVGETNITKDNRSKIAAKNGIRNYTGTAAENTKLLKLLKQGKLKKVV